MRTNTVLIETYPITGRPTGRFTDDTPVPFTTYREFEKLPGEFAIETMLRVTYEDEHGLLHFIPTFPPAKTKIEQI